MSAMPSPAQSEFSEGSLPVKPAAEAPAIRPADLKNDRSPRRRQSLGMRAPLAVARFLITFGVGVAATLAWQSYGDAAREMIANSSPQLGWLAPQAAPVAQSDPDPVAPAASAATSAAPSPDQQQLNAVSLDLDAMRQSVDRIAASQEQITRTVDQLAAGQEQMAREISKVQAIGQYMLYKNSDPPPRPAAGAAPAPKPVPRQSQAPTVR